MSHATVRATILPEIIRLICVEQKVSEREALDLFYGSTTGANFADDDTGLLCISTDYLRKKCKYCKETERFLIRQR